LKACTGIKYDPQYLKNLLAKGVDRDYILNKKFGVRREEDTLPKRFLEEPLIEGASKGSTVNIKKMVGEYNKLHDR
jgi:aldehyde:ferredoxin oxidoreductase